MPSASSPIRQIKLASAASAPPLVLPESQRPKRMEKPPEVVITDIRIPFGRMAMLMLKVSLASLPAALVMALIGLIVALMFAWLGGL